MRSWDLKADSPYSLRIAADARLCVPNYVDDQIWELRLGKGEPPSLALFTTYGLRARSMQIFPGFRINGQVVIDPDSFFQPPRIRRFFPNYLQVECLPFQDIEVRAEYWIAESNVAAGRFSISNHRGEQVTSNLLIYAILRPGENPQVMTEREFEGALCLTGRSGNCCPLIFVTGGALLEHSPYPALRVGSDLQPGETRHFLWAHAASESPISSFAAAREILQRPWDEEVARLEMINASLPEVFTGDEDRDAAFAFSQKIALGSLVGPTRHLSHPSPISGRQVDRGFSEQGDGLDYDWQWNGQTAIDAYQVISSLITVDPKLAKGVLLNFLDVQAPDGSIDWKPGLGGQRNGALCIPILAHLAWMIYLSSEDQSFLEACFSGLLDFFRSWFTQDHDRDMDGHPEWDSTLQSGFDEWPSFVLWHIWGGAFPISEAETPDLASYLLSECNSLLPMASLLHRNDEFEELEEIQRNLKQALQGNWSDEKMIFQHKDRDLHTCLPGELLGEGNGSFKLQIERTFDDPSRIVIKTECESGRAHPIKIALRGKGRTKRSRTEHITKSAFHWFWDVGTTLVERTFTQLDSAQISQVDEGIRTEIRIPDFTRQDHTCFLPLFAGAMEPAQAKKLIRKHLLNRKTFWRKNGIPNTSAQDPAYTEKKRTPANQVHSFWNTLIGEGLLYYGYRAEAAELVIKLLTTTLDSLRSNKAFRSVYLADRKGGVGEVDHLLGISPLALFMNTLGLRLISPQKIYLYPQNPFPWPVSIHWKGLEINWLEEGARVVFEDGEEIQIHGHQQVLITRGDVNL